MSFRNWITRIFWGKGPASESKLLDDLNNLIQSFTNDAITFREKIIVVHKNILYEKDKHLNAVKRELEEKQGAILELQKLIGKQQEIIKELREHGEVTYVPSKEQEETIAKLKTEINRYQEIIKTYEESASKLNAELEKIRSMYQQERIKYQEVANQLEKEREIVSSLEREIRKEHGIDKELKEDIEKKTSLISEYEKSARILRGKLEEISNRYQEASEKYEKEKQNAIRLEMLILDLDKELGLLDIVEKIEAKKEEKHGITVKNSGH